MDPPFPCHWPRSLDFVLSDRVALDAFRQWISFNSTPEPLDLYFAIKAFERMVGEGDARTAELALSIHQRYTSLRTGCCSFIPGKIRQEVGLRAKCASSAPDPALFSPILPYLDSFLRKQHQQFVSSDEFIDAFNKFSVGESVDVPIIRLGHAPFQIDSAPFRIDSLPPPLTAEALLKSRQDRENTLGESTVERLYAAGVRAPYVCRATTSHNDSAVSSSFSADTHGSQLGRSRRLRSIREEHVRGNPITLTIPRVETTQGKGEGPQFDHSNEEGRRIFFSLLSKKLMREITKRKRNDETARQLRDIGDRRCSARDVISCSDAMGDNDDEDDLERYVERMRDESRRTSGQRSPGTTGRTPGHFSPDRSSSSRPAPYMSHSMTSYTPSRVTPRDAFAPPPAARDSFSYYKDRSHGRSSATPMYDSSGIASMTSEESSRHSRKSHASSHATPRRQKKSSQLITISYKGSDGVPVVAHVPFHGQMTLREFRRHFSISSQANVQFFFKSESDEDSAPYQLLLVNQDSAPLPIFHDKISAELKSYSPQ